jgi:hypothetical protein
MRLGVITFIHSFIFIIYKARKARRNCKEIADIAIAIADSSVFAPNKAKAKAKTKM